MFSQRNGVAVVLALGICLSLSGAAHAALLGYWPLDDGSGSTAANLAPGGTIGTLYNSPTWVTNDPARGTVLSFNASNWVDAGDIPALTTAGDFTWSFWASQSPSQGVGTNVILGNRFPRTYPPDPGTNFIKFTPASFEYRPPSAGTGDINYADIQPGSGWMHHAVVKKGTTLTYYRGGILAGTGTVAGPFPGPLPLYFGGDAFGERWQGRIDDVATWDTALSKPTIRLLASGCINPLGQALNGRVLYDDFSGPTVDTTKWDVINQGLESSGSGGMTNCVASTTVNPGCLTLSGQAISTWNGESVRSVQSIPTGLPAVISVDRVSVTGVVATNSAYRSSLWIWGDSSHYFHFSQNVGEGGWSWNARDDGGTGTSAPTGSGNFISAFDGQDTNQGNVEMKLFWLPSAAGGGQVEVYLNDVFGASWSVSNFPGSFKVMLSGMPRISGDTVTAVFDNLTVFVIPEPATLSLLGLGALALLRRRRA